MDAVITRINAKSRIPFVMRIVGSPCIPSFREPITAIAPIQTVKEAVTNASTTPLSFALPVFSFSQTSKRSMPPSILQSSPRSPSRPPATMAPALIIVPSPTMTAPPKRRIFQQKSFLSYHHNPRFATKKQKSCAEAYAPARNRFFSCGPRPPHSKTISASHTSTAKSWKISFRRLWTSCRVTPFFRMTCKNPPPPAPQHILASIRSSITMKI